MYFLDELKSGRIYKNRKITALSASLENPKKDQMVVHLGATPADFISFLNSDFLRYVNFSSYYLDRRFVARNRKVKKLVKQGAEYKALAADLEHGYRTKISKDAYANRNLITDATTLYNVDIKSIVSKSNLVRAIEALKYAIESSAHPEYGKTLVYINLDTIASYEDPFSLPLTRSPLSILYLALRRKLSIELDIPDYTIVIGSPSRKMFLKLGTWEEAVASKTTILSRLKTLVGIVNGSVISDEVADEIEPEETPEEQPEETSSEPAQGSDVQVKVAIAEKTVKSKIRQAMGLTKTPSEEVSKELDQALDKQSQQQVAGTPASELTKVEPDMKEVLQDEETTEKIADVLEKSYLGKTVQDEKKKNDTLLNNQDKAVDKVTKVKNLNEKRKTYQAKTIDRTEKASLKTVNKEVKKTMMINDFDNSYIDKQYLDDLVGNFKAFNDDEAVSVYIDKIDIEDSSDSQTYKDTFSVKLKDDRGTVHNVKVDVPKVFEGKYIKVNGSKKIITKQLVMLPVVKTKPTEVWITTNYNKIIMERFGRKNAPMTVYLSNLLKRDAEIKERLVSGYELTLSRGNSVLANGSFPVSIDYMDISSTTTRLFLKGPKATYEFFFNQKSILEYFANPSNKIDATYDTKNYYPIGLENGKTVLVMPVNQNKVCRVVGDKVESLGVELSEFIIQLLDTATGRTLNSIISQAVSANQSMTYSRCKILGRLIPTAILIAGQIGLENMLKRAEIDYTFSSTNKQVNLGDGVLKMKLADGYIIYDAKKSTNSLLVSGLNVLDSSAYTLDEMNGQEPYLAYYQNEFKSRNVARGVHNALSLMVDPITKEVLQDLGQPTNILDIFIYANRMLEDLSSRKFNDMNIYRVRGAEQINAILYKLLADSYKNYKESVNNRNPQKISLPKDLVLKEILKANTLDESSDLNPSLEIDKQASVTFRGPAGRNNEASYTNEIRGYDKTMEGVLGITSPDSKSVGMVRQLSYDTKLNGIRGYIDTSGIEGSDLAQFSALELMNPFTARHADAPRIGMQSTQSKHHLATISNDPLLVSSGIERAIPYQVSDIFAIKAKDSGTVKKVDKKLQILVVSYDSGKTDVFDIAPKLNKNSNGGFYVGQHLSLLVAEGDTFAKGDILAKNDDFFKGTKQGEISYVTGKLSKIAISSSSATYEDSSIITDSMSEKMAAKVSMKKAISIGKAANIQYLVKPGQLVKTGQPLAVFEPQFDDSSINSILDKLGQEYEQEIQEISNKVVKSKYTGRVVRVDVYYNRELTEFSPSVRQVIEDYIKTNEARAKRIKSLMAGSEASLTLDLPTVEKIDSDKIHGEEVDGLLLEIFVEYEDKLSIGDKITFYTALKTVIADTIPADQAPYSSLHPEEEIEAVLSPLSIVSRMVPDVYQMLYSNKALIELKKQVAKLFK